MPVEVEQALFRCQRQKNLLNFKKIPYNSVEKKKPHYLQFQHANGANECTYISQKKNFCATKLEPQIHHRSKCVLREKKNTLISAWEKFRCRKNPILNKISHKKCRSSCYYVSANFSTDNNTKMQTFTQTYWITIILHNFTIKWAKIYINTDDSGMFGFYLARNQNICNLKFC